MAKRLQSLARRGFNALAASLADRIAERLRVSTGERSATEQQAAARLAEIEVSVRHVLESQSDLLDEFRLKLERALSLVGQIAGSHTRSLTNLSSLAAAEFRVTSQGGEDGILEWLCHQLGQKLPRSFVELGVETYAEANTRFLLENRGWKGLVLDGNEGCMQSLRDDALSWRHDITAVGALITAEDIDQLIGDAGFAGELGILSIGLGGNDYWVLDAISVVDPVIVICEVNGVYGDLKVLTVPYDPAFDRLKAHHSGRYFGCSLQAACKACRRKGLTFVGTDSNGVNAFFVRDDLAPDILAKLQGVRCWPPRHRDSRDLSGDLTFTRGSDKVELIADMPVVDLESDSIRALGEMQPLFSEAFERDFA